MEKNLHACELRDHPFYHECRLQLSHLLSRALIITSSSSQRAFQRRSTATDQPSRLASLATHDRHVLRISRWLGANVHFQDCGVLYVHRPVSELELAVVV